MICSYCREYYLPVMHGDGHGCELQVALETVTPKAVDVVNHPPHYNFGKYEVIDVLEDWFATEPHLWQVAKYIARAGRKGDAVEDLKKARWYLDRKIQLLESK